MSPDLHPGVFLLAGALILPLLGAKLRPAAFLVFPALALFTVWSLPEGDLVRVTFFGYELTLCAVDPLSRVFGLVFSGITLIGGIYAYHVEDKGERVAALVYASGALGVTFAGDFFTLLMAWELMTIPSAYLIMARRSGASIRAGIRYLIFHLTGGGVLLAGIALHLTSTRTLALEAFGETSFAAWIILAAVAINAAIPPLHAWLPDSYPNATVTGAVFLSAFTTKSAVYVLARLFPGWEVLIWLGVIMALYGVVYAVLANDIRQILAYHIISQVGYMVAGVGLGTALALNGTAAHAFSHILYKALLFMGAGAVLLVTGRSKLTELGGLARAMPWTVGLYMVGAFSISGFPLFNGFISKSMIVFAAGEEGRYGVELLLMLASVGTFLHTGLKLPYWTWFGGAQRVPVERPIPHNMSVAMSILAFLCILFGVWPRLLYGWLPTPVDYQPYTPWHLVETTQLLIFTFVAFWWMRVAVGGKAQTALDLDWFYRRPGARAASALVRSVDGAFDACERARNRVTTVVVRAARNPLRSVREGRLPDTAFDPNDERSLMGIGIALLLLLAVALAVGAALVTDSL